MELRMLRMLMGVAVIVLLLFDMLYGRNAYIALAVVVPVEGEGQAGRRVVKRTFLGT